MKKKFLVLCVLVFMVTGSGIHTVEAKHYNGMEEMALDLFTKILTMKGKKTTFNEKDYEIIKYDDIMREREGKVNVKHTFYAEVQQYDESDGIAEGLIMRDGDLNRAYYFIMPNLPKQRLMKEDVLDVYGTLYGLLTYETVMGGTKTVPVIIIDKVLVKGIDY